MTHKQAKKLKPGKSNVWYAGAWYRFVRLERLAFGWYVVIWDEPPSKHEDRLNIESVSLSKG